MSRLPIDKTDQARVPRDRDGVWRVIRQLRNFTARELRGHVRMSERGLGQFLTGLHNAGILSLDSSGLYVLVRDHGIETPRVREDGSLVQSGLKSERLWRTARILGEFSIHELWQSACADDCAIKESYAKSYTLTLHRAGYIGIAYAGGGRATRYRLIKARYSGPKAPMIQRGGAVYDPNLKRVVWTPEGGEA